MVKRGLASALLLSLLFALPVHSETVALNPDHPDRYVVRKGDTLWDISGRFLRDPWMWPKVWDINPSIENPHLIYPGDTITLRTGEDGAPVVAVEPGPARGDAAPESTVVEERIGDDGRRTVKLAPQIRASKLDSPIPTIPMDVIQQFLLRAQVVSKNDIDKAGYVVAMEEGHLIGGSNVKVYARELEDESITRYRLFRTGEVYRNPGAKKDDILGYEAIQVADAQLEDTGDPSTLVITHSYREALRGDRLMPAPENELNPYFIPQAPENPTEGKIIALIDAVSRVGQYQVTVLNLGEKDGLKPGHVLAAFRAGETARDEVARKPEYVQLPDLREGIVMVFRVFDRVSYALVMEATRDIRLYDAVRNP